MTVTFYVKTNDSPKVVAEAVSAYNFFQGKHPEDKYSWVTELGKERSKDEEEYYEIKGKYAPLKDLTLIAIVERTGDTVALSEIDDNLSPNFADPLHKKYGFDNVKWMIVPAKS